MNAFPERVLLATDGSDDAAAAARAAADLSGRMEAELHVVHAWQRPHEYAYRGISRRADDADYFQRHAEESLRAEKERLESLGGAVADSYLELGRPADAILGVCERIGAGLIVVGSRGLGAFRRIALGSVSEEVVHHARVPVLVVRGGEETWPPQRVVVGDDGSEDARKAGELAVGLADLLGVPALLVRAHQPPPAPMELPMDQLALYERMVEQSLETDERELEERARELEGALGVRPRTEVAPGNPAVVLDRAAGQEETTLVAVGSRGFGAVKRMALGSISTKILRAARGPVLVHPHHGP